LTLQIFYTGWPREVGLLSLGRQNVPQIGVIKVT